MGKRVSSVQEAKPNGKVRFTEHWVKIEKKLLMFIYPSPYIYCYWQKFTSILISSLSNSYYHKILNKYIFFFTYHN